MTPEGFRLYPAALPPDEQSALLREVLGLVVEAPLHCPVTPGGRRMSVQMTNFGEVGWVSDVRGYRYASVQPATGTAWPPIPDGLQAIWRRFGDGRVPADCCLVNLYRGPARLALHQDRDEADFTFPVVSVSLGDTAVFRLGGTERRSRTRAIRLSSGDVCVLAGAARLAFHGVDRVVADSSRLIPGGGRISLTLRRATIAGAPAASL